MCCEENNVESLPSFIVNSYKYYYRKFARIINFHCISITFLQVRDEMEQYAKIQPEK